MRITPFPEGKNKKAKNTLVNIENQKFKQEKFPVLAGNSKSPLKNVLKTHSQ